MSCTHAPILKSSEHVVAGKTVLVTWENCTRCGRQLSKTFKEVVHEAK